VVGKVPAVGLTVSQAVPVLVIGVAVKLVTLELELETVTVCADTEEPPDWKTKLSEFGFAEMGVVAPLEFAFKVTGTVRVADDEVMLIKPTSIPEVGAPAPMETVRSKGVVPDRGVTVSQLVSENVSTERLTAPPLAAEIRTLCTGVVTPV
jgi:hypothetical protein